MPIGGHYNARQTMEREVAVVEDIISDNKDVVDDWRIQTVEERDGGELRELRQNIKISAQRTQTISQPETGSSR